MEEKPVKIEERKESACLITEHLDVGYQNQALIRDIALTLKQGKILTLFGPNGVGKSTILKSITRQLALISGCVYLEGKAMQEYGGQEFARKVAVVMTGRLQSEWMSCYEVVATGRYPYTGRMGILGKEDKEKVEQALALVQAQDLAKQDFTRISDGQRQRIMLARAICQEPEIIVLDEPTSYLDIRHKLELMTLLKDMVVHKQVAVMMSLHELDLAQRISDYVMCVRDNHIDRYGTPEEVFTQNYMEKLYGMTRGSYNARFGCLELEAVRGTPKVFVIGGNGSAAGTYRRLQREGIPFATGVIPENDLDYPVAKALAAEVITEKAFEPISAEAYEQARKSMGQCEKVICCTDTFGTMNRANEQLLLLAKEKGLLEEM